jgi:uncharacterized protein YndB with AHSA1/START domain
MENQAHPDPAAEHRGGAAYFDWSRFQSEIFIGRPASVVYRAWALPSELQKWFIEVCEVSTRNDLARGKDEFVQNGDQFRWFFDEKTEGGVILEAVSDAKLSFTISGASRLSVKVTVHFKSVEGGTLVQLVQENMPHSEEDRINWHLDSKVAWTFFLANLKAYLEHNVDLRVTRSSVEVRVLS